MFRSLEVAAIKALGDMKVLNFGGISTVSHSAENDRIHAGHFTENRERTCDKIRT